MILVIHACAQGSLCGSTIERLRAEAEHISSPTRSLITFLSNLISLRHAKFRLRADSNVLETCRDRFERHGRQTSQDPIDRSHRRSLVFRRALSASTSQPFDRLKAGLRAAEIAKLSWDMVLGPSGEVGVTIELQDKIAKKGSDVQFPFIDIREALIEVRQLCHDQGPVIRSERGGAMTPMSIVVWFSRQKQLSGIYFVPENFPISAIAKSSGRGRRLTLQCSPQTSERSSS